MSMASYQEWDEDHRNQRAWDEHLDVLPYGSTHHEQPHTSCPAPADCPCQCVACFPEAYEREQAMNARRRLLRVGDAVLVRSVRYPEIAPWPATITAVNTAMVGALAPYYRVDNGTDQWVWWENVTPAD